MKCVHFLLLLSVVVGITQAFPAKLSDDSHHESYRDNSDEEEIEEKRPYSFAWKASRYYNGAPDREHIEERNEDGITRGVFRYVDPRQQIQEVVYHSDDTGFHVDASNLPQDTAAVSAAKERHQYLFEQIKREHEKIGKELKEKNEEYENVDHRQQVQGESYHSDEPRIPFDASKLPKDTPTVYAAKQRHQDLFERIRKQHERIGIELGAPQEEYV